MNCRDSRARAFTLDDRVVIAVLLVIGVCQFLLYARGPSIEDDVFFSDAALSMIHGGVYGIGGRPETNQPPGLSMLLAGVCLTLGCDRSVFLRTMIVSATLGLIAAYALLRREMPSPAAAAICVLLAFSAYALELVSNWIFPDIPFLLATMLALLAFRRLEEARRPGSVVGWGAASAVLTGASILLRSAGMALVAAIVVRGITVLARDRNRGVALFKAFVPALLVGLAVQGAWMHRKPAPLEWPDVPGYPGSYLSQLKVVSGNQPELGTVAPVDIPVRIARKVLERSKMLVQFLVGRTLFELWGSPVVWGVLLFLTIGWGHSIRKGGGAFHDWYFAAHELIYLLWPWDTEVRFVFPVAPLMCLYLWRGIGAVVPLALGHPRLLGLSWAAASVAGFAASIRGSFHGGVAQRVAWAALWIVSGSLAARMAWSGRAPMGAGSWWKGALIRWRTSALSASRGAAAGGYAGLLLVQLASDAEIVRENLHPSDPPAKVEAALWVRSHTEPDAVVMARHVPIVEHISQRKVVWFPPLSDPFALMTGIRRLGVRYVLLGDKGAEGYYRPPDYDCFARLLSTFPDSFRVSFQDERAAIYEVIDGAKMGATLSPR